MNGFYIITEDKKNGRDFLILEKDRNKAIDIFMLQHWGSKEKYVTIANRLQIDNIGYFYISFYGNMQIINGNYVEL